MMWLGTIQKVRFLENKEEKKMKHKVEKKVRGVVGTCSRKPQTLFWYSTNFKCFFGIFFNKTWDYVVVWIHVFSNTKKIDFYSEFYVHFLCEFFIVSNYDDMNCNNEVQILVICNNHESNVGMNGNVKFVET
jgi:hypothetical protein